MSGIIQPDEIIRFINVFTSGGKRKEVIETFTRGCCYWFAVILQQRFGGTIVYDSITGHFMCEINGSVYDINGLRTGNILYERWDIYDASTHKLQVFDACVALNQNAKKEE